MKSLTIVVVLGIILGLAHAHTYHLGECPTVEPQADFNMKQLKSILSTANVNPFDLSIIDQSGCPKDYDSGIYIHKDTFTAHNIAGAIRNGKGRQRGPHGVELWRKTVRLVFLDPGAPQWLRSRLSNAGVNPYDLSLVSHTECGPEATAPEAGIHINPETFSSHNIGQAVKKVGESIGDGVESLSDGAKKLFHKIKGDGEGKDREEVDVRVLGGNRQVTTEQYAEWLP
ncbi:uncharacterized protein LOC103516359 [Diaphorina citri]|uniref:Uncharacterized protein LOC103516359 n=1 Tax=Diaphorina citri TaxID=121845 RepID=A0A3Q0JCX3_DIACI|nr:uncharacterized protein LOC103516359 [Diaphorina citri]